MLLAELGDPPELGLLPRQMYASVVRPSRYGPPETAMQTEIMDVPPVGPGQALVWVMGAGVNYNNIWAGYGEPIDVIALRHRRGFIEDFHIGGTDASGIVWAVGEKVREFKVGDEVIVTGGQWDETSSDIRMGADPTASRSTTAWGYEGNYGAFAQFALGDEYQLHPKPPGLPWLDAGCFAATAGTVYRQLSGWYPHTVRPGDPVLIWGGAGGLGSMAIQLVRRAGGLPVAVVSSQAKAGHCRKLGAEGVIDRREFDHWGRMPDSGDRQAYRAWQRGVYQFQKAFWQALGQRRDPVIVLEHPGQDTFATSVSLCERGGMVVICGGTSGYHGEADLRMVWVHQKRIQGSHMANTRQLRAVIELAGSRLLDPCRSQTFPLAEAGTAHQALLDGTSMGNLAIAVNAPA